MNSWISTLGLYNYDESLFDELKLPDGVDKEVLIDNLLIETAELEILYSDFDIMKHAIGVWSKKELPTWNKLDELFKMEYNPIYNVDANEILTEDRDLHGKRQSVNNSNEERDLHNVKDTVGETNTSNTMNGESETINQVSGFNGESFVNRDKSNVSESNTNEEVVDNNVNEKSSDTGSITNNSTNDESSDDYGTITTHNRRYGNIGVTMTQQMIRAELDVRGDMNIMNYIIDSYKNRFCLLVY